MLEGQRRHARAGRGHMPEGEEETCSRESLVKAAYNPEVSLNHLKTHDTSRVLGLYPSCADTSQASSGHFDSPREDAASLCRNKEWPRTTIVRQCTAPPVPMFSQRGALRRLRAGVAYTMYCLR